MLRVNRLQFAYDSTTDLRFPDILLNDKEHLLILGESGIGKTTFLHLMAGLLKPQKGSVVLGNIELNLLNSRQMDQFRGKNIGIVFQRPYFLNSISLQENLLLIQYLAGNKQNLKEINTVLERLGIANKANTKPSQLSQGEQQRASIAMAIINKPSLLLADEPTASLDDKNCNKVAELLIEQAALTEAHLVIITHDTRLKNIFKNFIEL